jgi:hypothetical protein
MRAIFYVARLVKALALVDDEAAAVASFGAASKEEA